MTHIPDASPPIFKWYRANQIAASGRPRDPSQLKFVAEQGVQRIISVAGAVPDADSIAELGLTCLHVPNVTRDLDALERAVDALTESILRDERVLLH